jgi:Zn-dependent peptidase ImmA (M78 family)
MSDDLVKRLRNPIGAMRPTLTDGREAADRIEELEAEVARLRLLVPRPDQTQDELVWRDHMRGVPLAALAKEFGVTKERMRYRLKKIAENKLHLTGGNDGN